MSVVNGVVYYKGFPMIEVQPYERCKIKVGILIGNDVRFYKFGKAEVISLQEIHDEFEEQQISEWDG
jgi:hypothetical protein